MLASAAIRDIFKMRKIGSENFVDGGIRAGAQRRNLRKASHNGRTANQCCKETIDFLPISHRVLATKTGEHSVHASTFGIIQWWISLRKHCNAAAIIQSYT